jgi:hypothetical protein
MGPPPGRTTAPRRSWRKSSSSPSSSSRSACSSPAARPAPDTDVLYTTRSRPARAVRAGRPPPPALHLLAFGDMSARAGRRSATPFRPRRGPRASSSPALPVLTYLLAAGARRAFNLLTLLVPGDRLPPTCSCARHDRPLGGARRRLSCLLPVPGAQPPATRTASRARAASTSTSSSGPRAARGGRLTLAAGAAFFRGEGVPHRQYLTLFPGAYLPSVLFLSPTGSSPAGRRHLARGRRPGAPPGPRRRRRPGGRGLQQRRPRLPLRATRGGRHALVFAGVACSGAGWCGSPWPTCVPERFPCGRPRHRPVRPVAPASRRPVRHGHPRARPAPSPWSRRPPPVPPSEGRGRRW